MNVEIQGNYLKENHYKLFEEPSKIDAKNEGRQLKEEEEALNAVKDKLLSNISHEIRTPLNGLMGMLQLLQGTELTKEQAYYVEVAKTSSEWLLKAINDILDYSKIEAGKVELEKHSFNLHEVVSEIDIIFKSSAQKKELIMEMMIGESVPRYLLGDSFRLRQVLFNLIGNAIKFTEKGRVDISVKKLEELANGEVKLEFCVKDTGLIGIPQDKIKDIFKSFTQVDSSTTRQFGGMGLGLSICKGLVEKMRGEIWVESKVGGGSTFFFNCILEEYDEIDSMQCN